MHESNVAMLWILLAMAIAFGNAVPECISDCTTISHHTLLNTQHSIPCSIQNNECAAFSNVSIPASKPVSKNPGKGWYLYPGEKYDRIALNFSWERQHEASVVYLQGYYFSVLEKSATGIPLPNLEKYYCMHIKLEFNLHIFAKYYYDCYGTDPADEILPGKQFVVFVASLPQPGPTLDTAYYKRIIKVPGCDDQRLSNVKQCVEQNSMKLVAKEYFCENRTAIIDYNLPTSYGNLASLILCYAEEYRLVFTFCDLEHSFKDLPMSNSNYKLVVPENFDIMKNLSITVYSRRGPRQVAYMKFVCKTDEPEEKPASTLNNNFVIIIVVCVVVALAIVVALALVLKRGCIKKLAESCGTEEMPKQEPLQKFEPNLINETIVSSKVITGTRTVCITFVGDNEMHKQVLLAFASFLQNDLGFKVIFELWDQDNIYKDASTWIANTLRDSDKVIVVWSPKACEKWNKFSDGENTDQQDLFTPILKQVQKDLVFNKNQGKYFFTFFEYCSETNIPEKFRDIIFRHFKLMHQFKELYFRLLDTEMFQPGSYEKQERVEHYFDHNLNTYGLPLKNRIEIMCNFVKKNPNWFITEPQVEEPESTLTSQSECEETFMVNKLDIAPPPPLFDPTLVEDGNEMVETASKIQKEDAQQISESQSYRKPVENMESYVAPDNGDSMQPNPQLQELLPKKPAKQASENLRLKISARVPCENTENVTTASQGEYPVLAPLNAAKPDTNSPQDSGICTLSPQPDSLLSNYSIRASSFNFDDDNDFAEGDEVVKMGESANSPELAPIDFISDPWQSLASFNV